MKRYQLKFHVIADKKLEARKRKPDWVETDQDETPKIKLKTPNIRTLNIEGDTFKNLTSSNTSLVVKDKEKVVDPIKRLRSLMKISPASVPCKLTRTAADVQETGAFSNKEGEKQVELTEYPMKTLFKFPSTTIEQYPKLSCKEKENLPLFHPGPTPLQVRKTETTPFCSNKDSDTDANSSACKQENDNLNTGYFESKNISSKRPISSKSVTFKEFEIDSSSNQSQDTLESNDSQSTSELNRSQLEPTKSKMIYPQQNTPNFQFGSSPISMFNENKQSGMDLADRNMQSYEQIPFEPYGQRETNELRPIEWHKPIGESEEKMSLVASEKIKSIPEFSFGEGLNSELNRKLIKKLEKSPASRNINEISDQGDSRDLVSLLRNKDQSCQQVQKEPSSPNSQFTGSEIMPINQYIGEERYFSDQRRRNARNGTLSHQNCSNQSIYNCTNFTDRENNMPVVYYGNPYTYTGTNSFGQTMSFDVSNAPVRFIVEYDQFAPRVSLTVGRCISPDVYFNQQLGPVPFVHQYTPVSQTCPQEYFSQHPNDVAFRTYDSALSEEPKATQTDPNEQASDQPGCEEANTTKEPLNGSPNCPEETENSTNQNANTSNPCQQYEGKQLETSPQQACSNDEDKSILHTEESESCSDPSHPTGHYSMFDECPLFTQKYQNAQQHDHRRCISFMYARKCNVESWIKSVSGMKQYNGQSRKIKPLFEDKKRDIDETKHRECDKCSEKRKKEVCNDKLPNSNQSQLKGPHTVKEKPTFEEYLCSNNVTEAQKKVTTRKELHKTRKQLKQGELSEKDVKRMERKRKLKRSRNEPERKKRRKSDGDDDDDVSVVKLTSHLRSKSSVSVSRSSCSSGAASSLSSHSLGSISTWSYESQLHLSYSEESQTSGSDCKGRKGSPSFSQKSQKSSNNCGGQTSVSDSQNGRGNQENEASTSCSQSPCDGNPNENVKVTQSSTSSNKLTSVSSEGTNASDSIQHQGHQANSLNQCRRSNKFSSAAMGKFTSAQELTTYKPIPDVIPPKIWNKNLRSSTSHQARKTSSPHCGNLWSLTSAQRSAHVGMGATHGIMYPPSNNGNYTALQRYQAISSQSGPNFSPGDPQKSTHDYKSNPAKATSHGDTLPPRVSTF